MQSGPSRDAPQWTETLLDGTRVFIRPIRKEDATLERTFIRRLSPESRRLRFLGQMSEPSDLLLKALTEIDYRRDVAFIALVHRDGEKQEIGVARYGTNEDGTVVHPATISWHLERLIKATGAPPIRLHDLRHTHATLGLAAGVPVKVMSERLGHASTQITMDLYSHVIPGMQADAAARIGDLLRRAR